MDESFKDFESIDNFESTMEDDEDLRDLREAKRESLGQESIPLEKAIADLGL